MKARRSASMSNSSWQKQQYGAKSDGDCGQSKTQSQQKANGRHQRKAYGGAHTKAGSARRAAVKQKGEQRTADDCCDKQKAG